MTKSSSRQLGENKQYIISIYKSAFYLKLIKNCFGFDNCAAIWSLTGFNTENYMSEEEDV